jgi:hypothetical protein
MKKEGIIQTNHLGRSVDATWRVDVEKGTMCIVYCLKEYCTQLGVAGKEDPSVFAADVLERALAKLYKENPTHFHRHC